MSTSTVTGFIPPYTHPATLLPALRQQGFALLPAGDVAQLAGRSLKLGLQGTF